MRAASQSHDFSCHIFLRLSIGVVVAESESSEKGGKIRLLSGRSYGRAFVRQESYGETDEVLSGDWSLRRPYV